jgi:antitoxin component of RelBE/YafQ-DinJ toxin-antitoxin module
MPALFKLSSYKTRVIWQGYIAGRTAYSVAKELKLPDSTVERHFRKFRVGIIPEFKTTGPLVASIDKKVRQRWKREAAERGISVYQLIRLVFNLIARDNLFNAVLGDNKYATPTKRQQNAERTDRLQDTINAIQRPNP